MDFGFEAGPTNESCSHRHWFLLAARLRVAATYVERILRGEKPADLLLTEMTFLVGSPGQLFFESPMVVDHLDGNYQRLAFCTYQQLARREGQLLMTDFHEQRTVRIAL